MTRNTFQIFKDKKPSLEKNIQDKKARYEGKLQAYQDAIWNQ
jgi:hypothetical protein